MWIQAHGLEWLFWLWQGSRRLWRRDLPGNPLFVLLLARQMMGETFSVPSQPPDQTYSGKPI